MVVPSRRVPVERPDPRRGSRRDPGIGWASGGAPAYAAAMADDTHADPARFLVRGRLENLPRRRADRDLVLRWVAQGALPLEEPVGERALTDRLAELARDPVGLRRELVEAGLVTRTRDGAEYWRTRVTEFDPL